MLRGHQVCSSEGLYFLICIYDSFCDPGLCFRKQALMLPFSNRKKKKKHWKRFCFGYFMTTTGLMTEVRFIMVIWSVPYQHILHTHQFTATSCWIWPSCNYTFTCILPYMLSFPFNDHCLSPCSLLALSNLWLVKSHNRKNKCNKPEKWES